MKTLSNYHAHIDQLISRWCMKLFHKNQQKTSKKLKNALWAICLGLVMAGILISFTGNSPLLAYGAFLQGTNSDLRAYLLIVAIYIFAAIAVGIGFQSGLFNIGVPGQMMLGGILPLIYLLNTNSVQVSSGQLFISFLIAIIGGFLVGVIPGILKAYFKVNEVVSTIMLNWVVYYLCQYLTSNGASYVNPISSFTTKAVNIPNFYNTFSYAWMLLVIAIVFAISLWWILKRTKLGYQIRMTGLAFDAAAYSGANNKLLTVLIMGWSGLLSGIAGYLYFVGYIHFLNVEAAPLKLGFDAIAISLLAYNSPLGIIFTSLFYSVFAIGAHGLSVYLPGLDPHIESVVLGTIIYFAAINVVFDQFQPLKWLYQRWCYWLTSKCYGRLNSQFRQQLITLKQQLQTKKINHLAYYQKIQQLMQAGLINYDCFSGLYWRWQKANLLIWWHEWKKCKLNDYQQHKRYGQLKKQLKVNWTNYLQISDRDQQLAYLQTAKLHAQQIQTQLDQLGYHAAKITTQNFFSNYAQAKQALKQRQQAIYWCVSAYHRLNFLSCLQARFHNNQHLNNQVVALQAQLQTVNVKQYLSHKQLVRYNKLVKGVQ